MCLLSHLLSCTVVLDKQRAIEWLERACEERAGGLLSIKMRPLWANLRSEPGFKQVVDKMGLNTISPVDP